MDATARGRTTPRPFGVLVREAPRSAPLNAVEEKRVARTFCESRAALASSTGARRKALEAELTRSRTTLIERNLRLVVYLARRYVNMGLELSDLVQEGNIGLMQAVERFDPDRDVRFSTYASWWIRQSITRALCLRSRTVRTPINKGQLALKALRASARLEAQLGRKAELFEIASALGVSGPRVKEALDALTRVESLDAPAVDGGTPRWELTRDEKAVSPWRVVIARDRRDKVRTVISTLPPREQTIVRMRFAIGFEQPHTLEEIGAALGLTRERVRQLEIHAMERLRREGRRQGLDALLSE